MSDNANSDIDGVPVLRLTAPALTEILQLRQSEAAPDTLGLCVEISGSHDDAYTYDMYFQVISDSAPGDWVERLDEGLTLIVPAQNLDRLRGAVLDLSQDEDGAGMVIRNPNRPPPSPRSPAMTGPPPDLSGDVAQRLIQVLEEQINPAIAAHGGRGGPGGGRGGHRVSAPVGGLRRLWAGGSHPQPGNRGGHPRQRARDRERRGRHRPRLGLQPVLRGRQEVDPGQALAAGRLPGPQISPKRSRSAEA